MKKWLFLFLTLFIFFSCKEVNNDQPNLSKWLISLIERDIDPDFEIKNDKTLNDSIQLKHKLNNAIQWSCHEKKVFSYSIIIKLD